MVHQPPTGARDLLPIDVAQKRWIEKRLQEGFHSWGYHRIITSTVERLSTLMAGGAIDSATVIQLQNLDEDRLGLRPELTASIARAAVTRMAGSTFPQRLYYSANIFRQADKGSYSSQYEFYQTGVELLGGSGVLADAEILLLLTDSLNRIGLQHWSLILGEASLTQSLLSPFPEEIRFRVQAAIANLDRLRLEQLPLSPELQERALFLMDLRGQPADVLQRVSALDLDETQRAAVNQLKSLVDLLHESLASSESPTIPKFVLDLSLIRNFSYYTGLTFEVVSPTMSGQRVLGQGGRYDKLLSLYHPQGDEVPGIGFCLNIEDIHQTLLPTGQLPSQTPRSDCLVVAQQPQAQAQAFTYAQSLRRSSPDVRAELFLDDQVDPDGVRQYARDRTIGQIAWITGEASPEIEHL